MDEERERQLVDVAREIRRYWKNRRVGLAGPNDIVFIERTLDRVLALYGDIPPTHDADRAEWASELLDRR